VATLTILPYEVKLVFRTKHHVSIIQFHELYTTIRDWCQARWPQIAYVDETWRPTESAVRNYRDNYNTLMEEKHLTFQFLREEDAALFRLTWSE